MVRKIVSGGQTGVDRAALVYALRRGLACGGWCPRGRLAEDGVIDGSFPLRETPLPRYSQRTQWNVRDSDGTLILNRGEYCSGGTALTLRVARAVGRPCLTVNLSAARDVAVVHHWLAEYAIGVLNVAGPRESENIGIFQEALSFLEAVFAAGFDEFTNC